MGPSTLTTALRLSTLVFQSMGVFDRIYLYCFLLTMNGSSDMPKFFLQKLKAGIYCSWSSKVEVLLRGRGLSGFVSWTDDGGDDSGKIQTVDQAMYVMLLSIEYECLAPVKSLRYPRVIWSSTLGDMFKATSEASIHAYIVE